MKKKKTTQKQFKAFPILKRQQRGYEGTIIFRDIPYEGPAHGRRKKGKKNV